MSGAQEPAKEAFKERLVTRNSNGTDAGLQMLVAFDPAASINGVMRATSCHTNNGNTLRIALKTELLRRGISQRELARFIGRNPSHVSRIIRGHAKPRARDRRRIAKFLGMPEAKLFPRRAKSGTVGKKTRNKIQERRSRQR